MTDISSRPEHITSSTQWGHTKHLIQHKEFVNFSTKLMGKQVEILPTDNGDK